MSPWPPKERKPIKAKIIMIFQIWAKSGPLKPTNLLTTCARNLPSLRKVSLLWKFWMGGGGVVSTGPSRDSCKWGGSVSFGGREERVKNRNLWSIYERPLLLKKKKN